MSGGGGGGGFGGDNDDQWRDLEGDLQSFGTGKSPSSATY